ncbi:Lysophospholipase L1 [Amycolatopsis arida]|uniref:Lysophospholipase L1 n=1 Tax=Amycolatopsis arida TaxID=587909 RepID=A0A1I5ZFU7_9PSEU|nr:SGNH/GDSL hydrolase family protein [Amycolatopsis arida]TDX89603.1 lysophospholipase L1-like esterase [Amycolatopsis arida]SFQ54997.1 Lysophospholipase L1 [Amycolatopsis arida]
MSTPVPAPRRFVALGDSFTEGVGDDHPTYPNGVRGWADRVAEELARHEPELRYANLAVRGRLLRDVVAEQLAPAVAARPDLVTLYAGGNDLMRPRVDVDALAELLDAAVAELAAAGATVVLFTGVDGVADPLFRRMRGRTAIYNEHTRVIAARHGALLVDMWAMRELRDRRMWAADRIHLNAHGHATVARAVLAVLGAEHRIPGVELGPRSELSAAERRARNLRWAREHAAPWIGRRLRGQSSGDAVRPKRPTPLPVEWSRPAAEDAATAR